MSSERFHRFLNLEKPRRAPADEPAPNERGRFGNVETPGSAPAATPLPQEATDRFREPKERPLDVAEPREGAQPFVRCARCEMDNTVYAATCQNCGADLSAPDQRAFNERLWAQRREQAAREKAELAEREKERERIAAAEASARRELAEEMARREGERVRDELDDARWGGTGGWSRGRRGWDDAPGDPTPWGIRLLRLVPNPALRIAAAVAAVGLPVLFIVLGGRGSGLQMAGMLLIALVIGLFSPNYRYYRRRRWWDWN
jgi:hypothetical protein